jgi:predicted ATPase
MLGGGKDVNRWSTEVTPIGGEPMAIYDGCLPGRPVAGVRALARLGGMPLRGGDVARHPVRRVEGRAGHDLAPRRYPASIPAVAQVLREGLDLTPGVTLLVGENGSGKSTLVEAVATAFGLSPEGGSTHSRHSTRPTESPLGDALQLVRGAGSSRWGFFLRAETMHGWYSYMEDHASDHDPVFHEMSHGESFLAVLESRFTGPGFFCLDEPEAALSFSSTLGLVAALQRVVARKGQVLCATHSPVLAAMPGARILEVGAWGLREAAWEDLEVVDHWRRYLADPWAYLRHLQDD